MNETLKVLETRRSCRNFDKERMVSEEDIQAVVKAGTYAATGMGRQSPIIIAVTNKELRDRLSAENAKIMGTATDPFYGAPVILIVLADKDIPTYQYDGSLVMGNLMNAAESLGLGSIWIHRAKEEFESDFGKKILADLGIEGIEIEDNVPLSESDTSKMFIDILPELPPDQGIGYVSFYLEAGEDHSGKLKEVAEALEEMRSYVNIGSGKITSSETEDIDWMNNWKEFFHSFTIDDILIKPT